jgi:tetratricopeptide (TPR) repeat protein
VFVDGCRLEAAESVCGAAADLGIDVLDGIASLIDKSLLRQRLDGDGEGRFWMLETIREYASERLLESGAAIDFERGHAGWCASFAEAAAPRLRGAEETEWLERVAGEGANIRAALDWSLEHEHETAVRIAAGLWRYWAMRGLLNEGRRWLEAALANVDAAPVGPHFWVLIGAGGIARSQGDLERAEVLTAEGLTIARAAGKRWLQAAATHNLSNIAFDRGDLAIAKQLAEEALAFRREVGDLVGITQTLNSLGSFAMLEGDPAEAKQPLVEALEISRQLGDREGIALTLENLAELLLEEDAAQARECALESLALVRALKQPEGVAACLDLLATLEASAGRARDAVLLRGAGVASRAAIGLILSAAEDEKRERALNELRAALSQDEFAHAWAEGQAMDDDQIADLLARATVQ